MGLHAENCKVLMNRINGYLNKGIDISWVRRFNIEKDVSFPTKFIYRLNAIPIKIIPSVFVVVNMEPILKFIRNSTRPTIAKTIFL